jgi:hypothetical protein
MLLFIKNTTHDISWVTMYSCMMEEIRIPIHRQIV